MNRQAGSQAEELYSLLVPLHQHRLIVPRVCVAEVVRYALCTQTDRGPSWLRGSLMWNDVEIPVISFEDLAGLPFTETGGRTRLAVFNALTDQLSEQAFAVLTEGFPQLVKVNRDVMEPDTRHAWPENGPVICQIRMINEYPLIPDLERMEALISEAMVAGDLPA
jgi:chemosensory pili system protein ChpC